MAEMETLPRLLADFEPAPGLIKADYADFIVEEIPLYPADGAGTHTYFLVEKAGLSTFQAVHDIAQALNVRRHEIGLAGMKDARAVTRQWMSVEHIEPAKVAELDLPRIRVVETTRHHNKLRLGHLRGNSFTIRVRQTMPERLAELQDALRKLSRHGVPNYFAGQRFGYRGDTWMTGRAIVRGAIDEAVHLILGRPTDADHGDIRRARKLYDLGNFEQAVRHWPHLFHAERRALKALIRSHGNLRRAFSAIDRTMRTFYVSAYQSHLFNRVVAQRLPRGLGTLLIGDLAWLHASGAVFSVTDVTVEQPRADRLEISPSGPLFGYRMSEPGGEPGEIESELLRSEELTPDAFRAGPLRVKGGRRALRFALDDPELSLGADARGPYLELRFSLSRGCYATSVLRELFAEGQVVDGGTGDEEAGESTS